MTSTFGNLKKRLVRNSPEALTATSILGLGVTSYLVAKASFKAAEVISEVEDETDTSSDPMVRFKERLPYVWKLYVPAGVVGLATAASIVGVSKSQSRRVVAAVSAYSITEKAFSEYRDKVVEVIGAQKEQSVRDDIARDTVHRSAPSSEMVIIGPGHVLCCELLTQRYFKSDMESLRKAQNDINASIIADYYVTLDEFYDLVGLSHTTTSSEMGWDSDKLMELLFSTVLTPDGEPCLAFDYNYVKPLA